MKALRWGEAGLRVEDAALPRREGEALVRVTLAGVCSTDLHIMRGYAGFSGALGHEFVGVVAESPDSSLDGRRVVGEINAGCGECGECAAGDARHCPRRTVLGIRGRDGAFAEYLSLPARNLHIVPDDISDRAAVFTEPLAAAAAVLDQVEISHCDRVAVIGDGKLGQLIARVVATTGCGLTLIGRHEELLRLAASAGIGTERAAEKSYDRSYDVVIEASGSASGFQDAIRLVRPRGTIILKSTFHGAVEIEMWPIVVNEIKIAGSRCGRFARALDLLGRPGFDLEPLIAAQYPLSEGVEAMREAARPGALKVLIAP
ncbi:MAG: alcohol dehydrogenase catalytic domain-containing protein [Acidobacteria bacterium]|nr:alcohol dehydrogenase catalytic domain-containing protein [Acidobacteriota bacterium]MCW5970499.1 alcohol dehydrogenase catalytic domain-containing protein [Blastocatellales bacterium]